MDSLSNEEIEQFIHDCQINGSHKLANTLFELLACREAATPIYQFIYNNPHEEGYVEWLDCNKEFYDGVPKDCRRVLYAAPQLPAVPDEITPDDVPGLLDPTGHPDEYACCVGADMWNKCRALMLNGVKSES